MSVSNIRLFTGNANPDLAQKIADHMKLPLGKALVSTFSDGETTVEIQENIRGRDVYIIQPTCRPANDHLMELLMMADAAMRASAASVSAVVPYFGYARQDRRVRSARVPISAKIVADTMASVGIRHLMTVDLHADQIQGFFSFPVDNIYASTPLLHKLLGDQSDSDFVVVSPDVGGVVRARALAKRLGDTNLAIIDKRRPGPNKAEVMHVIGDIKDKHCLIVDDIVDTAGTLCAAATALKENGAKSVRAYGTHPVLSGNAIENIDQSALDQLIVTDTIPLSEEAKSCSKIDQITLSELIAETICRIGSKASVSSLFE